MERTAPSDQKSIEEQMSGETITVAIITIASVICAAGFVAAVFPSILASSAPILSATNELNDRIETDISIIHEAVDPGNSKTYVWVKSLGTNRFSDNLIESSDIFFGEQNNFMRIPYNSSGAISPSWKYSMENSENTIWEKGETIQITINAPIVSETEYFIKFTTYNGIATTDYFTV